MSSMPFLSLPLPRHGDWCISCHSQLCAAGGDLNSGPILGSRHLTHWAISWPQESALCESLTQVTQLMVIWDSLSNCAKNVEVFCLWGNIFKNIVSANSQPGPKFGFRAETFAPTQGSCPQSHTPIISARSHLSLYSVAFQVSNICECQWGADMKIQLPLSCWVFFFLTRH